MRISTHCLSSISHDFRAASLVVLLAVLATACGNKGDLYLPVDPEVALELEQAAERLKKKKEEEDTAE